MLRRASESLPTLLVVDELGPLELQRDAGLSAGIAAIDGLQQGLACVVVRPSLVDVALKRWPDAVVVDVED